MTIDKLNRDVISVGNLCSGIDRLPSGVTTTLKINQYVIQTPLVQFFSWGKDEEPYCSFRFHGLPAPFSSRKPLIVSSFQSQTHINYSLDTCNSRTEVLIH